MKSKMMNVAMKNGLILGILFSINFFLSVLGTNILLGLLSYVLLALIIYLTYRYSVKFRDIDNDGTIKLGQSVLFVFLMFFFASLISALAKYVFLKYINPDFLLDITNQTLTVMEQIFPSVPEDAYNIVDDLTSPINYTIINMIQNLFYGYILGLIIGLMIKKDKNPFQSNPNSNGTQI